MKQMIFYQPSEFIDSLAVLLEYPPNEFIVYVHNLLKENDEKVYHIFLTEGERERER